MLINGFAIVVALTRGDADLVATAAIALLSPGLWIWSWWRSRQASALLFHRVLVLYVVLVIVITFACMVVLVANSSKPWDWSEFVTWIFRAVVCASVGTFLVIVLASQRRGGGLHRVARALTCGC